jgi:hypothetical protein
MADATASTQVDFKTAVKDILETIEREREREIISRRFGLYDRRETLERIGNMLGITRERVRQLEKAVLARLKAVADSELPHLDLVEKELVRHLHEMGRVARISDLTARFFDESSEQEQAHVEFLATLTPGIDVIDENDDYYQAVAISEHHNERQVKEYIDDLVEIIQVNKVPITADELHGKTDHEHPDHVHALSTVSKKLAFLNGKWGSTKWPTVNPKNIRDKIYVVLSENGKPLHFSEISEAIKQSDFKRRNVTTQAIHNELIKDSRFVLIGRGIYALSEWGYSKGTVADVISEILKAADKPLHRDEIVKQVLKRRKVKETTILLNLQGKPQFKRTAKATYTLA